MLLQGSNREHKMGGTGNMKVGEEEQELVWKI